ncbi:MAG: hypothetical protein ACREA8_11095, partial [Nitrosotalea sp.]
PHVTGAVAILLQKYPGLDPSSIASIITTTTDPVTDAYGKIFPINVAGSGRLNITRASSADLIISPRSLVFNLSYENSNDTRTLYLHSINNTLIPKLKVQFSSNESRLVFNYTTNNNTLDVQITDNVRNIGDYDGFITIDDSKTLYRIPVLVHVTKGTIKENQNDSQIDFTVDHPDKWSYAKISLMKAGSQDVKTIGITPQDTKSITIYSTGEYWIQADIKVGNKTDHAYKILMINHVTQSYPDIEEISHIPIKQIVIISSIIIIAVVVILVKRR